MTKPTKHLYLWQTVVGAALVGGTASFIQIIERIQYAEAPTKDLFCNLNSVFSCSNVFGAWQSSVFGFSNAIMCLAFFAVLLGAGLAGLTGAQSAPKPAGCKRLFLALRSLVSLAKYVRDR